MCFTILKYKFNKIQNKVILIIKIQFPAEYAKNLSFPSKFDIPFSIFDFLGLQ
jgi:hypothetical protein